MRRLLALFGALLLAGCGSTPEREPVADPQAVWQQHRQRLEQISEWQLQGKLGVQSETQSGSAQLDWWQSPQRYRLQVVPPFGIGKARLEGDDNSVTLYPDDKAPLRARDPQALMQRQLGWSVPLDDLRFWVLGLPGAANDYQLDPSGHLQQLQHAGWKVEFIDYRLVGELLLPSRLYLRYGTLELRLAVRDWQLGEPQPLPPAKSTPTRFRPPV